MKYLNNNEIKILFIGNSLTYYNDMPNILKEMLLEKKYKVHIQQYTNPGVQLWTHFKNSLLEDKIYNKDVNSIKFTKAERLILEDNWDFVIIQGGTVPMLISGVVDERLSKSFENLNSIGKGKNIILFETWPSLKEYLKEYCYPVQNSPSGESCSIKMNNLEEEVEAIEQSYKTIANKYSFQLSNSCEKFYQILLNHNNINLYEDDIHPNKHGAFLNACVFYKMLTGDDSSKLNYHIGIEKEKADIIKKIVDN